MRNFEELKELLTEIKSNDYAVPTGIDVDEVIADMLMFIGHTDAEMRDKLIYSVFFYWAEIKGVITPAKMKEILDIVLGDEYLFYCLGERDTDSVFTRAFSSLFVSVALYVHSEIEAFLSADDLLHIKKIVLQYVEQEKDYRGYVIGKGWAHAVAHIADVLVNLSCCKDNDENITIGRDGMLELLQAVKNLICNKEHIYDAEEDERLVTVFMVATDWKIFTTDELIEWIDSFNMGDKGCFNGEMPASYNMSVNRKNFMRSLYFRLQSQIETDGFAEICAHMYGFLIEKED